MPNLTQDLLKDLLHYDPTTGHFTWNVSRRGRVKAGDRAGTPDERGYLLVTVSGRIYKAHRLAWLYSFGEWPEDEIDHINGQVGDNRLTNLRDVTRSQNNMNRKTPKTNKSGVKGVYWFKRTGQWKASIKVNKKSIHLGCFTSLEDAARARRAAEKEYFGNHGKDDQ